MEKSNYIPDSYSGSEQDWENTCRQCGRCCFMNMNYFDQFTISYLSDDAKCKNLQDDNTCAVYDNRFELSPNCCHISRAVEEGFAPDGCSYMEGVDRKIPHFEAYTPEEFEKVLRDQELFVAGMEIISEINGRTVDECIKNFVEMCTNREKRECIENSVASKA